MVYLFLFTILGSIAIVGMGHYLARMIQYKPLWGDRIVRPIENKLFSFFGFPRSEMGWKQYFTSILTFNLIIGLFGIVILMTQGLYTSSPNMPWHLAVNTVISFMTNTNLQHYAGEVQMSEFAQMFVIISHMFSSAATGIAVGMAFTRGITGSSHKLGNFYKDLIQILIRVLLPVSFIISIVLMWQGVPQVMNNTLLFTSSSGVETSIPLGPIASFEAIKHLGTNGGGYYAANSSMPFENPTLISNLVQMLSMITIPGGFVVAFGLCAKKDRKQGFAKNEAISLLMISFILFIIGILVMIKMESRSPVLESLGIINPLNLEGKELRFGILNSTLFTGVSTSFTTGSVNSMIDSYTPLGGMVPLAFMMFNMVFGGDGVGLLNMMMYVILTVFICGLMVGRTPEYLSKKIESYEMKRVALVILIHPILILGFTALSVILIKGQGSMNSHGLTQMLYEYTSAAANNGSGFEGLMDGTLFWNLSTAIVMFVGRFLPILLQLQIAQSLWKKQAVVESSGTLKTNTPLFTVALGVIIIVISALTFFPALMLGPITESLIGLGI